MYVQNDSIVKNRIRELLFEEVKSSTKTIKRFITLCNTSFNIETNILERFKNSKGICYEFDKRIFKKAEKNKPGKITLLNTSIYNHEFKEEVDFIWLDLYNSYTDTVLTNIVEFTKKIKWSNNAIYAITLNLKRGCSNDNLFYGKHFTNYKKKGVINHIGQFIQANVESVKTYQYTCSDINPMGASMYLIIFKLKK